MISTWDRNTHTLKWNIGYTAMPFLWVGIFTPFTFQRADPFRILSQPLGTVALIAAAEPLYPKDALQEPGELAGQYSFYRVSFARLKIILIIRGIPQHPPISLEKLFGSVEFSIIVRYMVQHEYIDKDALVLVRALIFKVADERRIGIAQPAPAHHQTGICKGCLEKIGVLELPVRNLNELFVLLPRHRHINIIVPRDEALMPDRA